MNLILKTDSYKLTHWPQYPEGTTKVYSYLESRGGKFDHTMFVLLQYYLKEYLSKPITAENIEEADVFCRAHIATKGVFNRKGWEHILEKHNGFLPLRIKAVPEGTLVPTGNVLMTIENTDPECYWLTNYMETLLMKVWAPITVATNSFYCKKLIEKSLTKTGAGIEGVSYKLHDFGYRGVSSEESAGILGAAHLVNFMGTDTIEGIQLIKKYYNWDSMAGLPGYSVVASEHSTATPYGRNEGERKYILNMLEKYENGITSAVIDSFDAFGLATLISTDPEIKEKILSRDGVFVLRPDSGDPVEVISRLMDILWNNFGGTFTDNHYKLLNPKVRIIQGDGIDYAMIGNILQFLENAKYATDNIIFGSGGGLLQKFDRDTQKFAIKCSVAVINGKEVNVQKDPITSAGKKSKQGYLKLHQPGNAFSTISSANETKEMFAGYIDSLQLVFENGKLYNEQSFEQVRKVANSY